MAGNSSLKSCAQKLLQHLKYPKEQADEILQTFKKQAKRKDMGENADEDCGEDDGEIGVDTMCEARLLSRVLQKMERAEATTTEADDVPRQPLKPSAPWSEQDRGVGGEETVSDEVVPAGCRLDLKHPANASPYVQGFLPPGESFRGIKSASRAFRPRSSSSSSDARVTRSFVSAKAEVLAFLWEWHDARQDAPQAGVENPGPAAAKRLKRQ